MVRHVLGISGGKDSAALAIYMKSKYPDLNVEYYNTDTGCELAETELLINRLESFLGGIKLMRAAEVRPEPTPFEPFLRASGNFLPSPQQRWCTQKMKLSEMERFVGDEPTISYVGIRGDEDREGYVSTKPNIQAIFPFRRNIWSIDVIHNIVHKNNIERFTEVYLSIAPDDLKDRLKEILEHPLTKDFYYAKKTNALMDVDLKLFNRVVFEYLKGTDYPVGKLEEFPLVDNEDVLIKEDIFRILEDSGVGVPAYYFCFFQQKIEWIWLYEQHPDLFSRAMEFEKDGYTWNQNESLEELIRPERVRQIKLDAIKKQEAKKNAGTGLLVDMLDDDDNDAFCANCFI